MKYEMIFGDEKLFDGVRDGIVALRFVNGSGGKLLHCKEGQIDGLVEADLINHPIVAMRRIIHEPKRWTWEDQKAGVLPEVGAELIHKTRGVCYFAGVGLIENACWALKLQSGLIYIAEKNCCFPIETPAEKAQRLRDEWCSECTSKYYPRGHKGFPEMIYDALLSGELPMPKKGGE